MRNEGRREIGARLAQKRFGNRGGESPVTESVARRGAARPFPPIRPRRGSTGWRRPRAQLNQAAWRGEGRLGEISGDQGGAGSDDDTFIRWLRMPSGGQLVRSLANYPQLN